MSAHRNETAILSQIATASNSVHYNHNSSFLLKSYCIYTTGGRALPQRIHITRDCTTRSW